MPRKSPKLDSWPIEDAEDRIGLIYDMSRKGVEDPQMQRLARVVVNKARVRPRDERGEVKAIFNFLKGNLPYRGDTRFFDTYMACYRSLDLAGGGEGAGGDCDDGAICLATLLWILGYATGAKIIGPEDTFTHIYGLVGLPRVKPTRWVPLDITVPRSTVGWEPPRSARRLERKFIFARDGVYELV